LNRPRAQEKAAMKRCAKEIKLAAGAFLIILNQFWFTPESRAADAPSLRVVYNALGGSMAPLWVAQELGLFAKHGLQHNLNYLAATTAVQALAAASEDIGLVGNQCIDVALEGADTVYIASAVPRFIFHLYGDPTIKSVSDLKGKVVAATQPSASTDYATRMVLRRFSLAPDKDGKNSLRGQYAGALEHAQVRQCSRRSDVSTNYFSGAGTRP
jgi:ABC-type nitrate/sulfonate/bicarbonate transport system substrate-binding protein